MDQKRFLTSKETAEYLDIPQQTLYVLCSQRKITYYQCGKRNYYDIADIYAYIMRTKIPAKSDKIGRRSRANRKGNAQDTPKEQANEVTNQ